jgi:hypothetical protein
VIDEYLPLKSARPATFAASWGHACVSQAADVGQERLRGAGCIGAHQYRAAVAVFVRDLRQRQIEHVMWSATVLLLALPGCRVAARNSPVLFIE